MHERVFGFVLGKKRVFFCVQLLTNYFPYHQSCIIMWMFGECLTDTLSTSSFQWKINDIFQTENKQKSV